MSWLWPMITPGKPAKVKPATSKGHSSETSRAVQAHLVPDAGQRRGEVRVVGQDRLHRSWSGRRRRPRSCCRCRSPRPTIAGIASRSGRGPRAGRRPRPAAVGSRRSPRRDRGHRELPVDHRAVRDDRLPLVVGVRRVQLVDHVLADVRRGHRAVHLVLHVAAQVPRHRLEPGHRVGRRPVLGAVVEPADREQRVLQGDLRRRVLVEVGVDARAERLEVARRLDAEVRQLAARRRGATPSCAPPCRRRGWSRRTSPTGGRR